jgi:hypothetical protein
VRGDCETRAKWDASRACPKYTSNLKEVEIFGNQEAAFQLDSDARLVETWTGVWDHDHGSLRAAPAALREAALSAPTSQGPCP